MRTRRIVTILFALSTSVSIRGTEDKGDSGRKELQQSCQLCHSLRLVETQRLSAAAWQKEVDKMIGWGALVPDRQMLIKYLADRYSDMASPPSPVLSSGERR